MNSIPQNARSEYILCLHPGSLTPDHIVDQVASHIQSRYEGRVIALVVQELAVVAPTLGEDAVMEIVTTVWQLAKAHAATDACTTWAHLSWFAAHAITTYRQGLRTLPVRRPVAPLQVTAYRNAG